MYSVFIADDNTDWLEALSARINADPSFQVVATANNGKTAIELIEQFMPDVIILDIIMPQYDGVYIVNFIREKLMGYFPIIYILSGIGTDTITNILNDMHIDFYSLKPISLDTAMQNLNNIVNRGRPNYQSNPGAHFLSTDQVIEDVLARLGMLPHLLSTKYAYEALLYYVDNPDSFRMLTKVLYPYIAEKHNTTPGAVEKNIRTGITQMKQQNTELYQKIFLHHLHKKVTNGIFLSVVSSYILNNSQIRLDSGK